MDLKRDNIYLYHGRWKVRYKRLFRRMYEFERIPDGLFIRVSWRNLESEIKPI